MSLEEANSLREDAVRRSYADSLRAKRLNPERDRGKYIEEVRGLLPEKLFEELAHMGGEYIDHLIDTLANRDEKIQANWTLQESMSMELRSAQSVLKHHRKLLLELAKYLDWDPEGGAYVAREVPTELLGELLALGEPLLLDKTVQELDPRIPHTELTDADMENSNLSNFQLDDKPDAGSKAVVEAKVAAAASYESRRQGFEYKRTHTMWDPRTQSYWVSVKVQGRPNAKLDRLAFSNVLKKHIPAGLQMKFFIDVEIPL